MNELNFLNISTEPSGSGGFVTHTMFWVAPDGTVHEVEFEKASEVYEGLAAADEIVMSGGEKEFFYDDNQMKFQFWIAKAGDPYCCPSGGFVAGTYKLQGAPEFDAFTRRYMSKLRIQVEQMQHSPPSQRVQK